MNVGLVSDFYYPWIGGPAALVRNLGHGLSARGHTVSLLAPSASGPPGRELDGPLRVERARSMPVPFGYRLRVAATPALSAARWLDELRPDVLHVHHPFPLSASAILLARRRGIPIVATNHTVPECSLWGLRDTPALYGPASSLFGRWIVWLLHRCDAVTTPTCTAASWLARLGYDDPIAPITNGVDTERFRPLPRSEELAASLGLDSRPVVLYTGRLDAEKQMDVWLQAAAILARRVDIQLLIGGKGPERARLEQLAAVLDIASRVRFFGYLDDVEFPEVYALADVYCITSPVELQSIGTLEAIASGLPAVGVRAGALPELIRDGENGLLAEPGDAPGIARALETILSDPGLASSMAEASRTIARQHDLSETIDRYESLLQMTAGTTRGAQP